MFEKPVLIVADENIPAVKEAFGAFGEVQTYSGRCITAFDVRNADALLVRSVTRVDETLLGTSRVRFVGSATIGTDHVDVSWLTRNNIKFVHVPGCNATSAAEYVIASLLTVAQNRQISLQEKTAGIIGCGNVGSRVQVRLQALGVKCLVCDPPRAEREGIDGFTELDELARADIVSAHVPLVREGAHATCGLISSAFIKSLRPGSIFINTSRGDVLDEKAMLRRLQQQGDLYCIHDVWKNEPVISRELAAAAEIATPHIAGYSIDGKLRATQTLHDALSRFYQQSPAWSALPLLPVPEHATIQIDTNDNVMVVISRLLRQVFNVIQDDRSFRSTLHLEDRGRAFDQLRKQYRPRRECSAYRVIGAAEGAQVQSALNAFGFQI